MELQKILDEEFYSRLVQSASTIIGHNVLITNSKGIVLASNDASRIGTLHEASLEAIATGEKVYHDINAASKLSGTRPGMTIPLLLEGETIGTIGISGMPEEISKYAILLLQISQLFMSFQLRQQTSAQIDYRKQNLLREIISFDGHSRTADEIYKNAFELGVDLYLPRRAIVIQIIADKLDVNLTKQSVQFPHGRLMDMVQQIFPCPKDFTCTQTDFEFVVLVNTPKAEGSEDIQPVRDYLALRFRQLQDIFAKEHLKIRMAVGSQANGVEDLRISYENAVTVALVLNKQLMHESFLLAEDILLERLAMQISDSACRDIAEHYFKAIINDKKCDRVMELISCWCNSRFNFSKTAQALHIHKSTLVYRFQSIENQFHLDLYDTNQVMSLYLLYLHHLLS